MPDPEELRRLRAQAAELARLIDARNTSRPERTPLRVGQVYAQTALPTGTGKAYAVHPVVVSGADAEGAAATLTPDTSSTVFFNLIGGNAASAGDYLTGHSADYRWVAERVGSGTTPPVNPCGTTWPTTLTYYGSVNQQQSGFYFADLYRTSPFSSPRFTTLTYGPRPADIPGEMELFYVSPPFAPPVYATMPDAAWWSAAIPVVNQSVNTNVYFYLWFHACQANVMVVNAPYTTGTAPTDTKGAATGIKSYSPHTATPFAMRASVFSSPEEVTGTHGTDDIVPPASGSLGESRNARSGATYTVGVTTNFGTSTTTGHGGLTASIQYGGIGGWTLGPGDTVTWSSSNAAVLTVTPPGGSTVSATADVVAVGPGSATISATIATTHSLPAPGTYSVGVTVT